MGRSWIVTPYDSGHTDLFDRIWDYDLTHGTIAMGWAEIDNVAECSEHELRLRLEQAYPNESINNAFRSFTRFYKQVKRGDIFIARKGSRRVIGFGEVSDDQPYYDTIKDRERIPTSSAPWRAPHFRNVQWKAADVTIEPLSFSQFPIVELTTDRPYYSLISSSVRSDHDGAPSGFDMLLKQKGQIILYGPPGTGKTYDTRRLAVKLLGD